MILMQYKIFISTWTVERLKYILVVVVRKACCLFFLVPHDHDVDNLKQKKIF